jgi:hypothetical protein
LKLTENTFVIVATVREPRTALILLTGLKQRISNFCYY